MENEIPTDSREIYQTRKTNVCSKKDVGLNGMPPPPNFLSFSVKVYFLDV